MAKATTKVSEPSVTSTQDVQVPSESEAQTMSVQSEDTPSSKSGRKVKFTGPSMTRRRITKKDWEKAGVEGMDTVEWSKDNQHEVDASEWPDGAIDIIKKQGNFRVSGD